MKPPRHQQRNQLRQRLKELGIDFSGYSGRAMLDSFIRQEAVIISVDRPDGPPEWCYGWNTSAWSPIRNWAMSYFEDSI